jgi:ATP-dependent RNA helicase DeaD
VRRADKPTALGRILDLEDPTSALVFARTRGEVEDLAQQLAGHGHDAAALHGGMVQVQRDRVMNRFRDGALDILVATDVAARGLDIEHVSHVVNYDIPSNPEAYVHRIGRTGRAGREGVAITLVEPREQRLLRNIERTTRSSLELAQIPTVADLRERRLEILGASLREQLLEDGIERFRAVVEPLAEEFDIIDVALAAVSLADQATARDSDSEEELAPARFFDDDRRPRGAGAGARPARPPARAPIRPQRGGPPGVRDGQWVRLFIGAGRRAGMRPGDLVGAITHEAGVRGNAVGAIQIADDYSLVEVPGSDADMIIGALSRGSIRGKKVPVRRER